MRKLIASCFLLFFIGLLCTSTLMYFSSPQSYQAAALMNLHAVVGV